MFKNLRWRLIWWFVGLTVLVYTSLTLVALALFHNNLTAALDEELTELAAEIRPGIDTSDGVLQLPEWTQKSHGKPPNLLATIQLFDADGRLLAQYGPEVSPELRRESKEYQWHGHAMRVISSGLLNGGHLAGYLQVQSPTLIREHALRQFARVMILLEPLLLLALGGCGYFFSGMAVAPVEQSFGILRRFMSDAGHELATPISIVQVNADAMENELGDNQPARNRLQIIERSVDRLGALVKDLSLLSKMESPRLTVTLSAVRVDKCLTELLQEFAEAYKAKNVELNGPEIEEAVVIGQADVLRRLFINLLQNAR